MRRRNTIWLATYPKSGTTWVRSLLSAVEDSSAQVDINALSITSAANRAFIDSQLGIRTSSLGRDEMRRLLPAAYRYWAEQIEGVGLLKTHDANLATVPGGEALFPSDITSGVIHVVRDPRDVAVSARHYFGVSQDEAIDMLNDPDRWILNSRNFLQLPTFLSDWSTHTASWLDAPLRRLTLRYEDLLADTPACLKSVIEFCGWEVSNARILGAVESCCFDRLREQEQSGGYSAHSIDRATPFFRSGRSGQWRTQLSELQVQRIVGEHRSVMERLGYPC